MTKNNSEIKVLYNSACPVCNTGISAQKNKMATCAVQWRDVHTDNNALSGIPAELEFVRERLHVIDGDGNLKVGLEAFEVIWQHSPKERWKAKIISLPVIKPILNKIYNLFAHYLYRWNIKKGHWNQI